MGSNCRGNAAEIANTWTDLRKGFDNFFATPEGRMNPTEMINRMIEIVPADDGKFRNVVPKAIEDMLKEHQPAAWDNRI